MGRNEHTSDALLIRTDSLGNILWKKNYGTYSFDDFAAAGYLGNKIILFYPQHESHYTGRLFNTSAVFKVIDDQNGQELRTRHFPHVVGISLTASTLLIEDDKIIGVGSRGQSHDDPGPDPGTGRGYSLALDTNFNPLWYRQYTFRTSTPDQGEKSFLNDFRPTSDGGYIGAGTLETFDTLGTGANLGYTAWVIKLDSNGCLRQSCKNWISVPELEFGEDEALSIYPNPSTGQINIEWPGSEDATVQLLDLQGRTLQSIRLTKGVGILNTRHDLPKGLYLVRVSTANGKVRTRKVLLQR